MPALFIYLLKANAALLLFCLGYFGVLRRLTFFTLNRVYLLTAIIFSSVYPFINLTDFFERHAALTQPVQVLVIQLQAPLHTAAHHPTATGIDYWFLAAITFWTGAAFLGLRLLLRLLSLYKLYRRSKPAQINNYEVRATADDISPFSFWQSIYLNPDNHNHQDLETILEHEQVHVREWHTFDILLSELSTIFYWINPGVWLMKKAVKENLEFITDRRVLRNGADSKSYQYSLLNVSFSNTSNPIVNNFNISILKQRIMMMNKKNSSRLNLSRYILVLPLVALLLIFTFSKATATNSRAIVHKLTRAVAAFAKIPVIESTPHTHTSYELKKDTTKPRQLTPKTDTLPKSVSDANTDYYIDGKKVSHLQVQPDNIASIIVISAKQARRVFQDSSARHSVVIFTKDKENDPEVVALMKRLNIGHTTATLSKAFLYPAVLTNIKVVPDTMMLSMLLAKDSIYLQPTSIKTAKAAISLVGDSLHRYSSVTVTDVLLSKPATVRVSANSTVSAKVSANAASTVTVVPAVTNRPLTHLTFSSIEGDRPLVIIDGKEAKYDDLKQINDHDIKNVSVLSGTKATEKYGVKGQNGVIELHTAKNKKD